VTEIANNRARNLVSTLNGNGMVTHTYNGATEIGNTPGSSTIAINNNYT
jgi:hypothetical protein